jgi:prevent-host-death family protein
VKGFDSIEEARARLSELVRAARAGRESTITDRGRAVARIVGVTEPVRLADRLLSLQAQGVLTALPTCTAPVGSLAGAVLSSDFLPAVDARHIA